MGKKAAISTERTKDNSPVTMSYAEGAVERATPGIAIGPNGNFMPAPDLAKEAPPEEPPCRYERPRIIPPILRYRVQFTTGAELFVDEKLARAYKNDKDRMGSKSIVHSIEEVVK